MKKRNWKWLCLVSSWVALGWMGQSLRADDIFSNPINGTNPSADNPFISGQAFDPNITVSGLGRGSAIIPNDGANRYNARAWNTTDINLDAYFEWTLTPNSGFVMDFNSLSGTWQRSGSGPGSYALRSSLDSFAGNLASGAIDNGTSPFSLDLSAISLEADEAITLRLYGWGASAAAGTFSINDFLFDGIVLPAGGGAVLEWLSGTGGSGTWTQTGGTNWSGGEWDSSSRAAFQGVPGTVTVSGTVAADDGVQFESDGYVVTGGPTDTLQLAGVIMADDTVTATIAVPVSGTSPLIKIGGGRIVLSGTNTFAGALTISAGSVEISSDVNLGNADNDVVLGSAGTLKTSATLGLDVGRDISGAGSLDIAPETKLTVNGNFNMTALTLSNSGTLDLQGGTRNVGNLTFAVPAAVDGIGPITASGLNAGSLSSGTAVIHPALELGTGDKTVNVGAGGALALRGDVALTGRLIKIGEGLIELEGSNPSLGSVRIGVVSGSSAPGGTVRIGTNTSLGSGQLHFNWGTLEAKADLSGINSLGNAISFGATAANPAIFTGSNLETSGAISFFGNSSSQHRIDVFNTTTLGGSVVLTGSVSSGLTVGGTGALVINGDASGVALGTTVTDTVKLIINSVLGAGVTVEENATLGGNGTINGLSFIAGTHAIGNDTVGTQTFAGGLSYLDGAEFAWELTANSDTDPGLNFDQLIVSGGDLIIGDDTTMALIFNAPGSIVDWTDAFWSSDHFWTVAIGPGSISGLFGLSSSYLDSHGNVLTGGSFSLGVSGQDLILTYAIPEPSVWGLLLMGGLAVWKFSRRRRIS